MKSERLKKLESELNDLQQWMKLGLVPKKELERHREEIHSLEAKIAEEKERLQFLKESGELEEFTAPRRSPSKTVYPDTPTMTDVDLGSESSELSSFGMDTDLMESDITESDRAEEGGYEGESSETEEEDEDPFSDRNRWRRGGIMDPDTNDW
jgi:hypothetical protein